MNTKSVLTLGLSLLLPVAVLPAITACSHGVVEVGASPDGYYDYDYYPDSEVYFYPHDSTWYWRDHDNWNHGRDLPHNFNVGHENHVPLHVQNAHPWQNHAQIHAQYPSHHDEHH